MKSTGVTKKKLRSALAVLGRTSTEIAKSLGRRRIKGEQQHRKNCPLAVYLKRCFPGQPVSVDGSATVGDKQIDHSLTRGQLNFVIDFDGGSYPGLRQV